MVEIAAGEHHSCARVASGRVFCWGRNTFGQLGDGTTTTRWTPVRVEGAWSSHAVQVGAGHSHSCLLRQSGRVACWGGNTHGELGDGTGIQRINPVPVQFVSNVTRLATGIRHTCALRTQVRQLIA